MNRCRKMSSYPNFFHFMVWLLICTFFLPAPMAVSAAENSHNAHVLRRLNSPERASAIAEAAQIDAAAREEFERSQAEAAQSVAAPALLAADAGQALAQSSPQGNEVFRLKSMGEVLFNYGAGFMGVPGLAPQRGVEGALDEGLGFHQDGTARKAGGLAGSSGPSGRGQRAISYIQSGFQNGYSLGLYDELYYDLWGRNDPTRGGLVSINGGGYSRDMSDFDPMSMAIDRGLNWGAGFVNSMGEAAISGLVDGGRARLNFHLDRDGHFSGEGDVLLPFYDSAFSIVYTQIGARSMHDSSDTRWIGNLGLGQRWFPLAQGDNYKSADYQAGKLMLGYNAFFDYDFTRNHQRGGVGAEVWYDWLRLSSNYYFPISSWKGSEDFDSRFIKERPAQGWDARVKAYLPFYRNLAITGAYSQWYGDHVGMFGAERLEKDPKVWSYGLEYTPIPLVSGFITQKSTERGRSDTEFGLRFTYHFQMPWDQQISHSKVAELRTVGGSRHEFVDRENRIVLEYKAKNAYMIEYLGPNGSNANEFVFRIKNGFDEFKAGQTVRVTVSGVTLAAAPAQAAPEKSLFARIGGAIVDFFSPAVAHAADFSQTYTTDSQGRFVVRVDSSFAGPVTLYLQAGGNTQSFTVNVVANLTWKLDPASGSGTLTQGSAGTLTLSLTRGGVAQAGINVSFALNPNIQGLPTSATTNTSGQIILTSLVVLASTDQTITATVDGNKLTIPVTVIPGTYTLEAAPAALTQHMPTDVTFTVKVNGTPVMANTSVSFTYNVNFTDLPAAAQMTNASGQFTVLRLMVTAATNQTIEATVEGQTVRATITVTPATPVYTLPDVITVNTDRRYADGVSANVVQVQVYDSTNFVNAGAGVSVSWAVTSPSSATGITLKATTSLTDASGIATMEITDSGGSDRSVEVKATVDGGGSGKEQSATVDFVVPLYTLKNTFNEDVVVGQPKSDVGFQLVMAHNDRPVAGSTTVTLSYVGLTGPASAEVGTSGMFSLTLTGVTAGEGTVTATWDSTKSAQCEITVVAPVP